MHPETTAAPTVRPGHASRRLLAIAVLIGGTSLAACEEDPVEPGHDEGDVRGFELRTAGGATLYSYDGPAGADTLELTAGSTQEVEVVWLDAEGDPLALDENEHSWQLELNSGTVTFVPSDTDAWRGTLGTLSLQPGNSVYSAFRLVLFHGADREFESAWLSARVTAP